MLTLRIKYINLVSPVRFCHNFSVYLCRISGHLSRYRLASLNVIPTLGLDWPKYLCANTTDVIFSQLSGLYICLCAGASSPLFVDHMYFILIVWTVKSTSGIYLNKDCYSHHINSSFYKHIVWSTHHTQITSLYTCWHDINMILSFMTKRKVSEEKDFWFPIYVSMTTGIPPNTHSLNQGRY